MSANAIETLKALYERVEMDESVGICLSSRVEALNFPDALAAVEALLEAAKRLGYAEFERADEVLVPKDDFATLAAAVRRVESGQ